MVIVIHQTANTENAFLYNEKKVEQKAASYFYSKNTKAINPFFYDKSHRLKELTDIEKLNARVKNKCLHISVNPSVEDSQKLNDKMILKEIDNFMQHMGYGDQTYFIYKHKDLERTHFHIVSTRIDKLTGKKIKDNHERQKAQNYIKELELRHQLDNRKRCEKPVFKFSAKSRNIKQGLESLFYHINQLEEVNSKAIYDETLKLFNVEISRSGRGHVVFVTDGKGKVIRYPIRLSKFKEKPNFYQLEKKTSIKERVSISKDERISIGLKREFVKELLWQIRIKGMNENNTKQYRLKRKSKRK
ncbi:relaxase/mobilization nuclease domain-containing protein [Labilibaculum sp. DW002]|uniref:Relaxase/mobilization nuclease domain-containing protein n=1 Tax=Paralabilibaculum antarcticum TaxID=2912572 RepID=A0ABT5VQL7_9BACT|nr:relaxase/mobilization nuclease domain-containing protein [Labilibaculum sp. DW002]MDE5417587.1 relaxase/mobilization nuclease domain-containing protein [Labilibaculum sp. DW002]